ncbi:hypothetical protein GIB67_025656 [Kingdonia uniflora]|uniref:Uncharacterized protein n=1 Tax=Kingdonia uniflora TaxID=39325 RepID=A0A7J7L8F4_9MAGN|nr:hypothetical protein GIB67_025656 [Kingdonia uniflora]
MVGKKKAGSRQPTHGDRLRDLAEKMEEFRIGLVLDAGIEEELRIRHLQVVDATRASLGLPIVDYTVTDTPLQVEMWVDPKCGKSSGRIKRPDSLLRAVENLINSSQVNAVAVVARFPDDGVEEVDDYRQGKGVDLLAGVEAVISHLVVKEFQIPCAHSPALKTFPLSLSLCPKSAAEEIGYTFLPCVLAGLSRAPQYVIRNSGSSEQGCIIASEVDSVILPINACGGEGILAFARGSRYKPLIIAVEENQTVLGDTPNKFGIDAVTVANYWEGIGVIASHKAGVDPYSLRRYGIDNIRFAITADCCACCNRGGKGCPLEVPREYQRCRYGCPYPVTTQRRIDFATRLIGGYDRVIYPHRVVCSGGSSDVSYHYDVARKEVSSEEEYHHNHTRMG